MNCQFFARCTNRPNTHYVHPVLGLLVVCIRCRDWARAHGG